MKQEFTHLHLHTEYSLLDGFTKIEELFRALKEKGMKQVAITDHGTMFGVVDFYKAAKKHGIHPVIGCEVYVAADHTEKQDKTMHHLVLLAENNRGYQNLIQLVSKGFVDGFYYKPRIDKALLRQHAEGLIALSACLAGEVAAKFHQQNPEGARTAALEYLDIFGPRHFFLEIQDQGIQVQRKINQQILDLAEDLAIEVVATNDVHYIHKDQAKEHDILLCIQTGKTLKEEDRLKFPTKEFYLKSPEEMAEIFAHVPRALQNTVEIANRCQVTFDFDKRHLPTFSEEPDFDSKTSLRSLCQKGLHKKYQEPGLHQERLDYELRTIEEMGFEDYFLIVWDFIRYAKEKGIRVGPGRGSVGGSLVAYVLDITTVDPIKYDLIFERFLNPERVTMPDIDIDFEDERRQEVIDYVIAKYGKDRVAQIITFGTFGARAAIRDVGRVLDIPYGKVDMIAKLIPFRPGMTLQAALKESDALNQQYGQDEEVRQIINSARAIEGLPRHASTHAAGVVISKNPVASYVPLYVHDGQVTTQFSMTLLEELGLLKMDFLGLRNLTIIKHTEELLQGKKIDLSIEDIPLDDQATFSLLSSGETLGIFQLESTGMRAFMRELRPTSIEDIIAGISLYRPGPMDSIPLYLKNKHHRKVIAYDHELLKDTLEVTYGCLVYQEQVMRIVRELAGYSYGRSDLVRRAMSKKKMEIMEKERHNFIYGQRNEKGEEIIPGCLAKGISEEVASKIYDDMIDFAKYAFNKSHAAGYAILAYQTAYLKAHYPKEFMAAVMSSVMGYTSKLNQYIQDVKQLGINILPPSVQTSLEGFRAEEGGIRYGLVAIKNVGRNMVKGIIEAREKGPFETFRDFLERLNSSDLSKRGVESLIKAGALDCFGLTRRTLLSIYEREVDQVQEASRRNAKGQMMLFDQLAENIGTKNEQVSLPEFDEKYLLDFEKDVMGIYLSGHPMQQYEKQMKAVCSHAIGEVMDEDQPLRDNEVVTLAGMVGKITEKLTKKQEKMAFVDLEDMTEQIEVICFPRVYQQLTLSLKKGPFVVVKGRLQSREDEKPKVIAEQISSLQKEKAPRGQDKKIYLKFVTRDKNLLMQVKNLLNAYKGETDVILYIVDEKRTMKANQDWSVTVNDQLIEDLSQLLGQGAVKYR